MSNKFYGTGNLGAGPELKQLEDSVVCNLRVYFDRPVPVEDDFEDKGGFWLNVEAWDKLAQACHDVLTKGDRVHVEGSLVEKHWKNDKDEDQSSFVLKAKRISSDIHALAKANSRS